jgi:carbamoyl-phosphate synthase large subunit
MPQNTLNGAGTSVYVFRDKKLEDLCKNIAELLDIHGTVNFEFIKDGEGQYYFLECNPRFSGGVAFSCKAGYDFVNNAIKCFDGRDIDVLAVSHNQYIVKQYTEVITDIE